MGGLSPVERIFNETMNEKAQTSNRMVKANRASHGPRVLAKAKIHKTRETPKEIQRHQKCEPRWQRYAQGQDIENGSLRSGKLEI